VTVQEVGPGCLAWLRLPGSWGQTNIGLVAGDGASLLVDTPWDRPLARAVLDAFAAQPPVATVFNTHSDGDHWWGNAVVPAGAEVVTSEACLAAMREEATPQTLARQRRLSSTLGRLPGRLGAGGRYVADFLAPYAFEETELRFPDRTFTGRREETVGGRDVVFIDHGAAHTSSDSVVFVPDARVVFAGDLAFAHVTPVMWHGPVAGWLGALDAMLALEADTFVPGHGPVGTRADLSALHAYWALLDHEVAQDRAAGRGPLEASRRIAALGAFAPFRAWQNPERLFINVATLDRLQQGKGPIPATPVARGQAFDGVAALCRHLQRR
jgi:glyoxylase-like metal-dependent hydrolase (beta-lactamase superfamily II)